MYHLNRGKLQPQCLSLSQKRLTDQPSLGNGAARQRTRNGARKAEFPGDHANGDRQFTASITDDCEGNRIASFGRLFDQPRQSGNLGRVDSLVIDAIEQSLRLLNLPKS